MEIPRREGMTALVIEDLPRVGPFRLEEGPRAFEAARAAARRAMDLPIEAGVVTS
jgi:NTE family protein